MKHIIFAAAALVGGSAAAHTTVCSGEKLYYSSVHFEFGTPPRPGTPTGTLVIAYDGAILLNHTSVAGLGHHGVAPYDVELTGPETVVHQEGNQTQGAKIYRQLAVVHKVDSFQPRNRQEVGRETVTCRQNWKMVQ